MLRAYRHHVISCIVMLLLALCGSANATSTISISSMGNGVFDLDGAAIDNAAAFDVTLTYDTATMTNPGVSQGALVSGGMMAVNVNTPGTVRIALIRTTPVSGSGTIATITFDLKTGSTGNITSLKVKLSDLKGKAVTTLTQIVNPIDASAGTAAASSTGTSQTAAQTAVPLLPLSPGQSEPSGTSTMPEPTAAASQEPAQNRGEVRQTDQSGDRAGEPGTRKNLYSQESVLHKFLSLKGERTAQAYCSLFDQEQVIGFRQKPAVVLSDGRTHVFMSFIAKADATSAPEAALTNARLVKLTKDRDNTNTWIADILPLRGAIDVVLAVSQEGLNLVLPLTVAPVADADLDGNGVVNEKDFTLFLKKRGTDAAPRFDMNRDGKRDAVDDFIFTANYLVASPAACKTAPVK